MCDPFTIERKISHVEIIRGKNSKYYDVYVHIVDLGRCFIFCSEDKNDSIGLAFNLSMAFSTRMEINE